MSRHKFCLLWSLLFYVNMSIQKEKKNPLVKRLRNKCNQTQDEPNIETIRQGVKNKFS